MEEKDKKIRIGKITFGIVLILVGITVFLQTFTGLDVLRYVLMLWPLVLIILGIEFLIYRNKENIVYDFLGSLFIFMIISIVSLFSMFNYGVNKVLYDDNFREFIAGEISNVDEKLIFENSVTFNNIKDNEKIKIKINETNTPCDTEVRINISTKSDQFKYKFNLGLNLNDYFLINTESSQITLLDSFEEFESIEITIVTSSKDNIIIK